MRADCLSRSGRGWPSQTLRDGVLWFGVVVLVLWRTDVVAGGFVGWMWAAYLAVVIDCGRFWLAARRKLCLRGTRGSAGAMSRVGGTAFERCRAGPRDAGGG